MSKNCWFSSCWARLGQALFGRQTNRIDRKLNYIIDTQLVILETLSELATTDEARLNALSHKLRESAAKLRAAIEQHGV